MADNGVRTSLTVVNAPLPPGVAKHDAGHRGHFPAGDAARDGDVRARRRHVADERNRRHHPIWVITAAKPCETLTATMQTTDARDIALRIHAGQRSRFGEPLVEHLARIASAVPADAVVVAWLHDAIERAPDAA